MADIRLPQNPGIAGLKELTSIELTFVQNVAALSYVTGDILYYNGSVLTRLAIGGSGNTLVVAAGIPSWSSTAGTGTVTSVAALTIGTTGTDLGSSVANGTTTPVITLNVPTASATNRGALSSTDWSTFNAKGTGTVTSVSVTTANGVSGSVATSTTTPAITLTLGAITPTSVNGNIFTTGSSTYTGTAGQTYTMPATTSTLLATNGAGTSLTGVALLASLNTYTKAGDQNVVATDASPFRTGSWIVASGDIYVLAGNQIIMWYESHNAPIDTATGNFLGRDETQACYLTIKTEDGFQKDYYAASNTAGVVPTWVLKRTYTYSTGGMVIADGFQSSTVTSVVATGTSPLTVTSTTRVANLNVATAGVADSATAVAVGGITGLGTGVATALAVNVGTAGAPVVNGGALGTPSSGTLTNCTALPIAGLTASTSTAIGVGSIELGHATDTSITRVAAGIIAVEGQVVNGFATTATATGTTTLTIASAIDQFFTGTAIQTVKLPTTSVVVGQQYTITNTSTGLVTVQSSGANTIVTLGLNQTATFTALVATPTTAANWGYQKMNLSGNNNGKRVLVVTQSATPATNTDNGDIVEITALAQAITSMTTSLTGTPNDGDMIMFQITDNATARAITWGTSFVATTVALPTTTVLSAMLRVLFQWDAGDSKWECIGTA